MPSSSEGSRVWSPSRRAATWSAEIPDRKLAPAVFLRLAAGQEGRRGPGVVARAVAVGPGLVAGQAAEDEQVLPERGHRLEDRRQVEAGPLGLGRPVGHDGAVGHVEEGHPPRRPGRRDGAGGERPRQHRLQEREGHDRADAPEQRPPRDPTAVDHGSSPRVVRIRKGPLLATPTIRVANRSSSFRKASRISSTAHRS